MIPDEILRFARSQRLAALATTFPSGAPQVAMVYHGVTDAFELVVGVFDRSRKVPNLRRNPQVALAIAEKPRTIQIQGLADEPDGADLLRLRQCMAAAHPEEFRRFDHLAGYIYVRITPTWVRYCDFSYDPNCIITLDLAAGAAAQLAPVPAL